jgi:hypothetical protein
MICTVLSAVAIGVIVAGQIYSALSPNVYAWPFTSYPMFSRNVSAGDVIIYRAQVECSNGVRAWWEPQHSKDKEQLSRRFAWAFLVSKDRDELLERSRQIIAIYIARDLGSGGYTDLEFPVKIRILQRRIKIYGTDISISERLVYLATMSGSRGG